MSKDVSKVTSKLQVTVPKAIAEEYGIRPGDEIEWLPSGDSIRVIPGKRALTKGTASERLRVFDLASARSRTRNRGRALPSKPPADRGWTREELHSRGRAD